MPLTAEQLRLKQLFAGNPLANQQLPQPAETAAPVLNPQDYISNSPDVTEQFAYTDNVKAQPNAYQDAIANRFAGITNVGAQATQQALGAAQAKAAADYAAQQQKANDLAAKGQEAAYVGTLGTASNKGMQYASPLDAHTGNAKRDLVLDTARAQIGLPYAWGGGTKKGASYGIGRGTSNLKGFDCSGLTLYAYSKIGINMSHGANAQARMGVRMPINKLSPGDLVGAPGHIAIYAGNGMMYEAPTFGKKVRFVPVRKGMFGVHLKY